jgi:hypothetical protein
LECCVIGNGGIYFLVGMVFTLETDQMQNQVFWGGVNVGVFHALFFVVALLTSKIIDIFLF